MNKAPAYQWYPDKAMLDMRRLSWAAKGIYRELLDVIWMQHQDTCEMLDDDQYIASELGCDIETWKEARSEIMHEYRPLLEKRETGRLFSKGLWKERVKQVERRETSVANGKLGGRPPGSKNLGVNSEEPKGNPEKTIPTPSPTPSPVPSVDKELSERKISAKRLAVTLLDAISKAEGRKLTSKPHVSAKPIEKLMKGGISEEEIEATILWLASDANMQKGRYRLQVQSGASLVEKWDRIQAAMDDGKVPKEEFLPEGPPKIDGKDYLKAMREGKV